MTTKPHPFANYETVLATDLVRVTSIPSQFVFSPHSPIKCPQRSVCSGNEFGYFPQPVFLFFARVSDVGQ